MTLPWYRRFPDNFIAGTVGLSLEEKGAYSLLLDLMYVRSGPVPDEPRYIAGVCNCSVRKWNAIRQRLLDLGKVTVVDGCLTNRRAEQEIEIARRISREAAENGAKGGNKSAQIRARVRKNNALAEPSVKLATSTANKKQSADATDPTEETVRLDRNANADLFRACEEVSGETIPKFMTGKSWPASIVARARDHLSRAGPSLH